jgi:superfamily I DNA/RNA helicase
MTFNLDEVLKQLGYEDPEKLRQSRTQEDTEFLENIIELKARKEEMATKEASTPEMEQALRKWQDHFGIRVPAWHYDPNPNFFSLDKEGILDLMEKGGKVTLMTFPGGASRHG